MADLAEVGRFGSHAEAAVVVALLRGHGVDAIGADTHTLSVNPMLAFALGGFRVLVPEDQIDEARALIADAKPLRDDEALTDRASWLMSVAALMCAVIPPRMRRRTRAVDVHAEDSAP